MKKSRRHALGQHFLSDRGTLLKIVKTIQPTKEDFIIEIGGGRGVLTCPLAKGAGKVLSIEIDDSLIPVLQSLGLPNLDIISGDILKQDLNALAPQQGAKLVGNLPYSISGPLLFKILFERKNISCCVFLIQKEVAVRVCAGPGGKDYAPLSIILHNAFERKLEFKVKPGAFSPPPKVDSAVISLKKRPQTLVPLPDERRFLGFLRGCFRHRRKTLANNLKGLGYSTEIIQSCLSRVDLPGNARSEELTLEKFFSLSQELGLW